ncbi:MAG: nucleotide pyrophosphohydrolase [Candidatus Shapirobacteria bacterium]|nr:nucleotide pyrophosphohydrolase [Candidatus Shapirobacteria bacterium]
MSDINQLTNRIQNFIKERDWNQFHNPKDLALSLVLESAEVMEHFQWKNNEEMQTYIKSNKDDIGEELADVLYWVLLMGHDLDIDIKKAFEDKMLKNEAKYPIDKAKGKHDKYNKL